MRGREEVGNKTFKDICYFVYFAFKRSEIQPNVIDVLPFLGTLITSEQFHK
jgi:hypothetical protein